MHIVPGTGLSASPEEVPPRFAGIIPLYPNVIIAAISVVLSVLGYWLYRSGGASGTRSGRAA